MRPGCQYRKVMVKKLSRLVLPTLEDIAPKLAGTRYFSKLDTSSGLWQIPLHPDNAKLTTFITPFGRFCFKRLAFGNTSAPESFQYLISDLLENREDCELIMDDIIVYGSPPKNMMKTVSSR